MARKTKNEEDNTETPTDVAPPCDPSEIPSSDVPEKSARKGSGLGRIRITHNASGKEFRRTDVIRFLWKTRDFDRAQICQVLESDYGHTTTYQVVFQATKNLEGGPIKVAKDDAEDEAIED